MARDRPDEHFLERSEIHALFRRLSSGVYVICVADGERRDAFTAAWLMHVSYDPLLLALSINPHHASYPILQASGVFTVSVLKRGSMELVRQFGTMSGRDVDKLAGVGWHPAPSGVPVLDEALAYIDCVLTATFPAGDHDLVLGRVAGGRILDRTADPMLYAETGDTDGSSALYPPEL
ncbi:MAG TPA: flavin reductase family protein [Gemmatimonadaceae bacterium]|nr:flavin reductase family protein [Gemmatimonadaceae bacterium]